MDYAERTRVCGFTWLAERIGYRLCPISARRHAHLGSLAPAEEAVQLYRDLAAVNPPFLPDLAGTLNNDPAGTVQVEHWRNGARQRGPGTEPARQVTPEGVLAGRAVITNCYSK